MADTVADFMLSRLSEWGISRIYGYPGDGINGLLGALDCASHRLHFVQARHEELAAFMACAHAKFTGEVGVCMATSGPGAIHLLNGLYDAKLDHQPVVAIVGIDGRMLGIRYPTEPNLIGDAAETLRVLAPYLERKSDRSWRTRVEGWVADWAEPRPLRGLSQPPRITSQGRALANGRCTTMPP